MDNVDNILKEYKEKGLIKDYGFGKFDYWNNIPFIILNNEEKIFLVKESLYFSNLTITTIYDYNIDYIKNKYLKKILDNQNVLKKYYIRSYGELLDVLLFEKI